MSETSFFPSPPAAYSLSAFDQLPNHGTYCLKYVPEKPIHRLPVSSYWKPGPRTRPQKRKTMDFLRETQMYIETIRKPQIVKFREKIITPRPVPKRPKTGEIAQFATILPSKLTYSLIYIGNLDGKITITTTRCPLQRRTAALLHSARPERRVQTQDWSEVMRSLEATRLPSRGDESRSVWRNSLESGGKSTRKAEFGLK